MQKAQNEISPLLSKTPVNGKKSEAGIPVIHEDGTVSGSNADADDDASTRGVLSSEAVGRSSTSSTDNAAEGVPVIRISTESDRDKSSSEAAQAGVNGDVQQNGIEGAGNAVEKPVQAAAGETGEGTQELPPPNAAQEPFSFSNKRLCERWLDNLFMVLYEVMRAIL